LSQVATLKLRTSLVKRTYMYTRKEILRVILDLGFTITLVKRSPGLGCTNVNTIFSSHFHSGRNTGLTSPIMEVNRYYIASYILYIINQTAQKLIRGPGGSMS
jgi:hypothetical protein